MNSIITVTALMLLTLIALSMTTLAGLFINLTNLEYLGTCIIIVCLSSLVVFTKLEEVR